MTGMNDFFNRGLGYQLAQAQTQSQYQSLHELERLRLQQEMVWGYPKLIQQQPKQEEFNNNLLLLEDVC